MRWGGNGMLIVRSVVACSRKVRGMMGFLTRRWRMVVRS